MLAALLPPRLATAWQTSPKSDKCLLSPTARKLPPLPGGAVIGRPMPLRGIDTLATSMARSGRETTFVYGGDGRFDHMRGFFLANGFERFVEQRHFDDPSFAGARSQDGCSVGH